MLPLLVCRDPGVGLEIVGAALDYKSRLTCFWLRRVHREDLGAGKVNAG